MLILPIAAFSQTEPSQDFNSRYYRFKNTIRVDSGFVNGRQDTTNIRPSLLAPGYMVWRPQDQRLYLRDSTKFRGIAFMDEISIPTLQTVTDAGNTTTNNIIANGGVNSSDSLDIGLDGVTTKVRLNRFVDLIGNATGSANGAFINFRRSDGSRTGAIGDGSSTDKNMYITGIDSNRVLVSMLTADTALAPTKLPAQFLPTGQTVINNNSITYTPGSANSLSVTGNIEVINTLALSSQTEYTRTGSNFKVSVGYLGNPEANLSANMDYTNSVHNYYDNTRAALWLALAPGSGDAGAWAVQYAPSGLASDIWTNSPFPYYIRQDRTELRVYNKLRVDSGYLSFQPPSQYRWRIRRTDQIQGLEFSVGSGRWKMNNFDSANSVYPNYEFLSTKGTDTKTIAFMHGNNSSMTIGQNSTTTPTATLEVAGSFGGAITTISANTTLDATHYTVIATAAITITLPVASSCPRRIYNIVNYNAGGALTISSLLRDGATTNSVPLNAKYTIQSNGTSWYVIGD